MTTVRRIIAPLCAVAGLCSGAAVAAPDCSTAPVLTPLQKRITSAAGEGVEPLRRFVARLQPIYRHDIRATMEQGMQHHEWFATCRRASAGSDVALPADRMAQQPGR